MPKEGSGFGYAQHLFMGAAILMLDGSKDSWPEAKEWDKSKIIFQADQATLLSIELDWEELVSDHLTLTVTSLQ